MASDLMPLLRMFAAVATVTGALLVALNWTARVTISGFAMLITASIAWMLDGWMDDKSSLIVQNGILVLINIVGIYRWLPATSADV
jgi:hypothetical protein